MTGLSFVEESVIRSRDLEFLLFTLKSEKYFSLEKRH